MADIYVILVNDHGLARAIDELGRRGLVKAERRGISEHIKTVRAMARSEADFNQASIVTKSGTRRGDPYGKVRIRDYKLRFYAQGVAAEGTRERHTRKGYNRGVEFGEPFMARTAAKTDPKVAKTIEKHIIAAVKDAGLV